MANNAPANPRKDGLDKAGEFLKLSLSLATGALVFGVALVKEQLVLSGFAKSMVIGAWLLLAAAAASGILALAAIPMMVAKENYDLEDKFLTVPARIHQVTFVLGMILLGGAAVTLLNTGKPQGSDAGEKTIYVLDCAQPVAAAD